MPTLGLRRAEPQQGLRLRVCILPYLHSTTDILSLDFHHLTCACMQARDTLGALADRCAVLKLEGGSLHVSRLLRQESRGLAVKRLTQYSANWVRSQNRMSSTSNQARRSCHVLFQDRNANPGAVIHQTRLGSSGLCLPWAYNMHNETAKERPDPKTILMSSWA